MVHSFVPLGARPDKDSAKLAYSSPDELRAIDTEETMHLDELSSVPDLAHCIAGIKLSVR